MNKKCNKIKWFLISHIFLYRIIRAYNGSSSFNSMNVSQLPRKILFRFKTILAEYNKKKNYELVGVQTRTTGAHFVFLQIQTGGRTLNFESTVRQTDE